MKYLFCCEVYQPEGQTVAVGEEIVHVQSALTVLPALPPLAVGGPLPQVVEGVRRLDLFDSSQ